VQLTPAQELAAVSSFLASLPQNVIPLSVDPSNPVDPQLILDFDTTGPRASEEVQNMVDDVWLRNPVFLYSKLYSPVSREVKAILADMRLRPAPTIIDVDVRDDAEVLQPILSRLTSQTDFPILIIGGRPVGNVERVREMVKSGELKKLVTEAGAVVNGARRKKHRK
jgi:glutaredoxin-related protein